jgi:hypothetical protein
MILDADNVVTLNKQSSGVHLIYQTHYTRQVNFPGGGSMLYPTAGMVVLATKKPVVHYATGPGTACNTFRTGNVRNVTRIPTYVTCQICQRSSCWRFDRGLAHVLSVWTLRMQLSQYMRREARK